jgi:DNA (cytosine-5)-methyltransferase 1
VRELALFAGAGGGILGGHLLGWRTVCAVESDAYAAAVLMARQNDGALAPFPIWDDVRTFDGRAWSGRVDVVSGGFPCQDISVAGGGAGIGGDKSGLWREMARIIDEVRPTFAFIENSPALTGRGLGVVLGDLSALGYDAEWDVVGASDVGAPHRRQRIWILARLHSDTHGGRCEKLRESTGSGEPSASGHQPDRLCETGRRAWSDVPDSDLQRREEQRWTGSDESEHAAAERGSWWSAEPAVGRVAHGVASRVDRLHCIGNGQVPLVAAAAFRALAARGGWA